MGNKYSFTEEELDKSYWNLKDVRHKISAVRPDGNICIIKDRCKSSECYDILMITGLNRGQRRWIRERDIIFSSIRKIENEDISNYGLKIL